MRNTARGFTLLELTVVLLIISAIVGVSLKTGVGMRDSAKLTQTQNKLDTIEKALEQYANLNGRLPCPTLMIYVAGDAQVATESANPGLCQGGTPAVGNKVDNIAEGGVPVTALGLSNEFMYDGWGFKIAYAVNASITAENAFYDIPPSDACGITLADTSTAARKASAGMYVLVSYGPNGHGAYTYTGAINSAGYATTMEKYNCNCDSAGALTAYDTTYMMSPPSGTVANDDYFDDIVRYKERWQFQGLNDRFGYNGYNGPRLIFGANTEITLSWGRAAAYRTGCGNWSLSNAFPAANVPSGNVLGTAFTSGNRYLFVYDNTPACRLYSVTGMDSNFTHVSSAFPVCPGDSSTVISMAPGNDYLAMTKSASPYIEFFTRAGAKYASRPFSRNAFLTADTPAARPTAIALSYNGNLMAISDNSSYAEVYQRLPNFTYKKLTKPTNMPTSVTSLAFSPDGKYLAAAKSSGSFYLWQVEGLTFIHLSTTAIASNGWAKPIVFSQDSRYIAYGGGGSGVSDPALIVMKIDQNNTFTAINTISDFNQQSTSNKPNSIAFSANSDYIALAVTGTGSVAQPVILRRSDPLTYRGLNGHETLTLSTIPTPQNVVTFAH